MTTLVLTKRHNYRLWQSGAFGNKLRAWRTLNDWADDDYMGEVVLRQLGGCSGRCAYNLSPFHVGVTVAEWISKGVDYNSIMVNEAAPDQHVILQGEYLNDVTCDEEGFALPGYFMYSTQRRHMRDALHEESQHTYGLRADLMLRNAMTPSSYEDWRVLLDQYPKHVLEVSIYDCCVGDTPGRNALVWEVRRY